MGDLVTWLRAQLDADERVARTATQARWWHNPRKQWLGPDAFEAYDQTKGEEFVGYGESPLSGCVAATGPADHPQSMADAEHIARWDPARVLAEVETKRALLEETIRPYLGAETTAARVAVVALRLLAQPYAGRPGWREEWRPT